tara:strand:+ start:106 stop:2160 length:2055 start_codon:yes stop_codon:yes gene_type:complete
MASPQRQLVRQNEINRRKELIKVLKEEGCESLSSVDTSEYTAWKLSKRSKYKTIQIALSNWDSLSKEAQDLVVEYCGIEMKGLSLIEAYDQNIILSKRKWLNRLLLKTKWAENRFKQTNEFLSSLFSLDDPTAMTLVPVDLILKSLNKEIKKLEEAEDILGLKDEKSIALFKKMYDDIEAEYNDGVRLFLIDGQNRVEHSLIPFFYNDHPLKLDEKHDVDMIKFTAVKDGKTLTFFADDMLKEDGLIFKNLPDEIKEAMDKECQTVHVATEGTIDALVQYYRNVAKGNAAKEYQMLLYTIDILPEKIKEMIPEHEESLNASPIIALANCCKQLSEGFVEQNGVSELTCELATYFMCPDKFSEKVFGKAVDFVKNHKENNVANHLAAFVKAVKVLNFIAEIYKVTGNVTNPKARTKLKEKLDKEFAFYNLPMFFDILTNSNFEERDKLDFFQQNPLADIKLDTDRIRGKVIAIQFKDYLTALSSDTLSEADYTGKLLEPWEELLAKDAQANMSNFFTADPRLENWWEKYHSGELLNPDRNLEVSPEIQDKEVLVKNDVTIGLKTDSWSYLKEYKSKEYTSKKMKYMLTFIDSMIEEWQNKKLIKFSCLDAKFSSQTKAQASAKADAKGMSTHGKQNGHKFAATKVVEGENIDILNYIPSPANIEKEDTFINQSTGNKFDKTAINE